MKPKASTQVVKVYTEDGEFVRYESYSVKSGLICGVGPDDKVISGKGATPREAIADCARKIKIALS